MGFFQNMYDKLERMNERMREYEQRLDRLDDDELIEKYKRQKWSCQEEKQALKNILRSRGYGNND